MASYLSELSYTDNVIPDPLKNKRKTGYWRMGAKSTLCFIQKSKNDSDMSLTSHEDMNKIWTRVVPTSHPENMGMSRARLLSPPFGCKDPFLIWGMDTPECRRLDLIVYEGWRRPSPIVNCTLLPYHDCTALCRLVHAYHPNCVTSKSCRNTYP